MTMTDIPTAAEHEIHLACGHAHRLNDECVVPADSPRGLLQQALWSTSTDPARALDRLAAIHRLQVLLASEEDQAVLGARMAGCTWIEMGEAIGSTRMRARGRWAEMVRRFEKVGFLTPEQLPPPVPPIDPVAAEQHPATAWCRWCGHRIVVHGTELTRWAHHSVDHYAGEGWIDVDCPGPEPWPADED